MNIIRYIVLFFAFVPMLAFAQDAKLAKTIGNTIAAALGPNAQVESIHEAGFLNLYEVIADGEVFYTDRSGRYLISGSIVDSTTRTNLTDQRRTVIARNLIKSSYNIAIKRVIGNGKRTLVTFEDPNCGYCRKLTKDLNNIENVTVYTFMLPMLSEDSVDKTNALWCSPDKVKAWTDWMVNDKAPAKPSQCSAPIQKLLAMGKKLQIHGTPTLFFADGHRVGGYISAAEITNLLALQ